MSAVSHLTFVGATSPAHGSSDFRLVHKLTEQEWVSAGKGHTVVVSLVLPGGPAAVCGVVRDPAGRPVPDAWVRVGLKEGPAIKGQPSWWLPPPVQVATNAQGRFEATGLRPGKLPIQVYAKGHAHWQGEVQCGAFATAELDVELQRGGSLIGKVTDVNSNPVSKAEVKIPLMTHPSLASATTDGKGSFRFDDLPPGELIVEVEGGNRGRTKQAIQIIAGHEEHHGFRLGGGPTIRGVLHDAFGRALVGWKVRRFQEYNEEIKTDTRGAFLIRDCAKQEHELEVLEPESSCVIVVLHKVRPSDEAKVYRIDEAKMPSSRIRGRIVDGDGAPLDGTIVDVSQDSIVAAVVEWTDTEGHFETPKLPPGTYTVSFQQDGFKPRKIEKVTLTRNQDRDLGMVRLERTGR